MALPIPSPPLHLYSLLLLLVVVRATAASILDDATTASSSNGRLSTVVVALDDGGQSGGDVINGVFQPTAPDVRDRFHLLHTDVIRWTRTRSTDDGADCDLSGVQLPQFPERSSVKKLAIYSDLERQCRSIGVKLLEELLNRQHTIQEFILVVSEDANHVNSITISSGNIHPRKRSIKAKLRLFYVTDAQVPSVLRRSSGEQDLFVKLNSSQTAFSEYLERLIALHLVQKKTPAVHKSASSSTDVPPPVKVDTALKKHPPPMPVLPADLREDARRAAAGETDGGGMHNEPLKNFSKTSVLFVSISFIILMIISLAWLVFYYVQRFRYAHAKDRLARRLFNAAKKALAKLPTKTLTRGDAELDGDATDCPVCIDPYHAGDVVRVLTCRHVFHKTCVDPWLLEHRTCPMCKMDILKADAEPDGDATDCPVCIDPYHAGDVVRVLTCRHVFHKTCVDPWLLEHRTCPMCKMDILKAFGYNFKTIADVGGVDVVVGGGGGRGGVGGTSAGLGGGDDDGSDNSSEEDGGGAGGGVPGGVSAYRAEEDSEDGTHDDPFSFSSANSPTLVQQVIHQGNVQGFSIIPLTVHSVVITRPASISNLTAGHDSRAEAPPATPVSANTSHHSVEVHHLPIKSASKSTMSSSDSFLSESSTTSAAADRTSGSQAAAATTTSLTVDSSFVTSAIVTDAPTPPPPSTRTVFSAAGRSKKISLPITATSGGGTPVSLREVTQLSTEPAYAGLTPRGARQRLVIDVGGGGSSRSLVTNSSPPRSESQTAAARRSLRRQQPQQQQAHTRSKSTAAVADLPPAYRQNKPAIIWMPSSSIDVKQMPNNSRGNQTGMQHSGRPVTPSTFHVTDATRGDSTPPSGANNVTVSGHEDLGSLESM